MLRILTILLLVGWGSGQFFFYKGACPPENRGIVAFREMTDVRKPIFIPLADRLLKDAQYAVPEIREKLEEVDITWKVKLPVNDSDSFKLFAPFLDRCCEAKGHQCESEEIVLQYVNYEGGTCWVVWPEAYFIYKKCTCCTCLLTEDCPVVGRCVEAEYHTVGIIAYCPHIMYSDRYQKIGIKLPTLCRCQAQCPTPLNYILPEGAPEQNQRKLAQSVEHAQVFGKK